MSTDILFIGLAAQPVGYTLVDRLIFEKPSDSPDVNVCGREKWSNCNERQRSCD
jgi:hypothetical protein